MKWSAIYRAAPQAEELPKLRRAVQEALRAREVSDGLIDNAGVLISELTHNAVEASETDHEVVVEVHFDDEGLHLAVECAGNQDLEGLVKALDQSGVLPGPESERGRGLWMILSHSRKLEARRNENGWVRVSMYVQDADRGGASGASGESGA